MKKLTAVVLALTALAFVAIGPVPRYIEELRIGGGLGEPVDGGADFSADGAIATDGPLDAAGDLSAGAFDAANYRLTLRVGTGHTAYLNLHEADTTHGGALWFDGALDKLRLGTRDGDASPTAALDIARGSTTVALAGQLTTPGRITTTEGLSIGASTLGTGGSLGIKSPIYTGANSGLRIIHNASGSNDFGYLFQCNGAEVFKVGSTGTGTFIGNLSVNAGTLNVGAESATRGLVTAWHGTGGDKPGCIKLYSRNGTPWYLFVSDSGIVRIHNSVPSSNNDGLVVGLQF